MHQRILGLITIKNLHWKSKTLKKNNTNLVEKSSEIEICTKDGLSGYTLEDRLLANKLLSFFKIN